MSMARTDLGTQLNMSHVRGVRKQAKKEDLFGGVLPPVLPHRPSHEEQVAAWQHRLIALEEVEACPLALGKMLLEAKLKLVELRSWEKC